MVSKTNVHKKQGLLWFAEVLSDKLLKDSNLGRDMTPPTFQSCHSVACPSMVGSTIPILLIRL